jgi:apolipoprotein D and lipocalin family protein
LLKLSLKILILLTYLSAPAIHAQAATSFVKLDPDHFAGTWYEIARYPTKREKNCANDAVLLVAVGDKPNQYQLETSCTDKKAYNDTRNFTANSNGSGVLHIRTLWPFSRPLWILATGPNYEWALAGTPNHKNLWIYSKTLTLSSESIAAIKTRATAQGFSPEKLIFTEQKPR